MKRNAATTVVLGVIIVGLGIGFLLDSLKAINFGDFIDIYWPAILILIGLAEFIRRKFLPALILLVLGVVFLGQQLNWITQDAWDVIWPIILIIIGANVVYRAFVRKKIEADSDDNISTTAIFGGEEKMITSDDFKSATVNGIFGGAKINLNKARIAKDGALIDVLALFGGVDIIVPKDMPVKLSTTNILGGSEDKRGGDIDHKKPTITIQGLAMFGGISIKSE